MNWNVKAMKKKNIIKIKLKN